MELANTLYTKAYDGASWTFSTIGTVVSTLVDVVDSVATRCLDQFTFLPQNPVTKHREIHLIPERWINWLGEFHYSSMSKDEITGTDSDMIKTIGKKIAAKSDRTDFDYEFKLIDQKDMWGVPVINAFCLPGGKVAVTKGLLDAIKETKVDKAEIDGKNLNELSTEDKVAAVIGHEITHACASHAVQRMTLALILAVAGIFARIVAVQYFTQDTDKTGKAEEEDRERKEKKSKEDKTAQKFIIGFIFDQIWSITSSLAIARHSQHHEFQSDLIGMEYAKKAGYDARGGIWVQKMFVKMKDEQQKPGWFKTILNVLTLRCDMFSSHPPSEARVQRCIEKWDEIKDK